MHNAWNHARSRCNNPNDPMYQNYGGRGITFPACWGKFKDFATDMLPTWAPGLTLDRVDNDAGYSPANCRWATVEEQAMNRRTNRFVTTEKFGRVHLSELRRLTGLSYGSLAYRLRMQWPEALLLSPARHRPKKKAL
jgi:hypothetical protein